MEIFKYPVTVAFTFEVAMPAGAKVLCVQTQRGAPFIWALVDPDAKLEPRRFQLYCTGQTCLSPAQEYVGTFQMQGGSLVFHLFESSR